MKDQLSTDAAGNLQNEIDNNKEELWREINSFKAVTTTFPTDCIALQTFADGRSIKTIQNTDGSIADKLLGSDGTLISTHTTTFPTNGSIVETIT